MAGGPGHCLTRRPRTPCPRQKLDLERETIELVHTEPTDVAQLPSRVPREAARYHFFLYRHTHEGDPLESVGEWRGPGRGRSGPGRGGHGPGCRGGRPLTPLPPRPAVFIYSMPGYKCSIRERMLYSSCKSRLLDSVEQDFRLEIAKKVGACVSPEAVSPLRRGLGSRRWRGRATAACWGETEARSRAAPLADGLGGPEPWLHVSCPGSGRQGDQGVRGSGPQAPCSWRWPSRRGSGRRPQAGV